MVSAVPRVPEEIPDEEHERIFDRVAAVDVAKESGMVCTRLPSATGTRRSSRVWQVPATVNAIVELAGQLIQSGVQKVTVESTSDYWRIWFYLLEAAGLQVQLVNAREVKNVPGRPKTDELDAVWLAKLTEKGLLRASFVPPAQIRVLRDYTRMRVDLIHDRTRYWQRLEKLLEDSLVKVTSVVSRLDGVSARDMLEALIGGQRDPQALAGLARGKLKSKHAALVQALHGRFDDHHGELARLLLDQIDALTRRSMRLPPASPPCWPQSPLPQPIRPHPNRPTRQGCRPRQGWPKSPASAWKPHTRSWPKPAWTCASSPPPGIWCPGPNCVRAPSSPAPKPPPARPVKETPI
jgi:transposase